MSVAAHVRILTYAEVNPDWTDLTNKIQRMAPRVYQILKSFGSLKLERHRLC